MISTTFLTVTSILQLRSCVLNARCVVELPQESGCPQGPFNSMPNWPQALPAYCPLNSSTPQSPSRRALVTVGYTLFIMCSEQQWVRARSLKPGPKLCYVSVLFSVCGNSFWMPSYTYHKYGRNNTECITYTLLCNSRGTLGKFFMLCLIFSCKIGIIIPAS